MRLLADKSTAAVLGTGSAVVLDSYRGNELWRTNDPGLIIEARAYLHESSLCLIYYGAQLYDAHSGALQWQRQDLLPIGLSWGTVWAYQPYQGDQFAGYYGEQVVLLDGSTGQTQHTFTPHGILGFSSVPVGDSSRMAVRTSDAIYLLNTDGAETKLAQEKCHCQCELAITSAGIVCVEYLDHPMPPSPTPSQNSVSQLALIRLVDAATGKEKWRAQKSHTWDVNMRPGVLRANERYVVLIKYPGLTVFDLASGKELYDSPITAFVMGPQWVALDGENLYWTGFDAQGMETGLERFNPATGQHTRLGSPLGVRLRDGIFVDRRLLLLGERQPLLAGGMNAVDYVISMPLP